MLGVAGAFGGKRTGVEAMADEAPTSVEAVEEGSNVGVNIGRRGVGAMEGNIERKGEVTALFDEEGGETSAGVNGGIIGDLEVGEIP